MSGLPSSPPFLKRYFHLGIFGSITIQSIVHGIWTVYFPEDSFAISLDFMRE